MAILLPRSPADPDVSAIPTPPRQAAALFIVVFFTVLALVAFSLRVYTRLRITRSWGLDDTLIVPAMVCSLLMSGPFYLYVKLGYFGWRQEDVPATYDPSPGLWWFYLAQIFYNPILAFVKCSVLVFILRVGGNQARVRYVIYGLIAFTVSHAIAVFFGVLLQCLPIRANWDPAVKASATCIDVSFHVIISSVTILTDLLVLALPFYVFLGLKMAVSSKVAVMGVFLSGGVVTAVSIIRLTSLVELFYFSSTTSDPFIDIKVVLNAVEVNLAIATACVPAMKGLARGWFPNLFGGSNTGYKGTAYGRQSTTCRKRGISQPTEADVIALKNLALPSYGNIVRGTSPTGSEEAILAYNGIVRTMDIEIRYDSTKPVPPPRESWDKETKA
ncbi:hypothetical protein F4778DRAFT_565325 [Xylariomycetidae sp. FL2044]|nr:hypothetical protein F4778DRAFT_565325 [Xylariomycetidae sp. FL2044]